MSTPIQNTVEYSVVDQLIRASASREALNRVQTVRGPASQETSALLVTSDNAVGTQKDIRSSISETKESQSPPNYCPQTWNEPYLISAILSHPVQEQGNQLSV